jgi:DNA-binding transcriptional LysR family regulator
VAAQKAQGIVDAYREFLVSVANFSTREVATSDETVLTILSIPRLVSLLIPAVTAQYRKASPEISFQVISQSSEEILKNFPHTANAIGFISYQDYAHGDMEPFQSATYPDLTVYPFLESQFYICMNQHSRYNTKSFFTGEDLEELPLISYEPALGQLANYKDAKLNVTSTVNDLRTLSSFIKQDLGVGLLTLSEYNSLPDAKKFIVKPVRSNTNLNLYFAYVLNQESNENANLQQFASMLVNHFSNKI